MTEVFEESDANAILRGEQPFSLSVLPVPESKRLFLCFYSVRLGTFLNEPLEKITI